MTVVVLNGYGSTTTNERIFFSTPNEQRQRSNLNVSLKLSFRINISKRTSNDVLLNYWSLTSDLITEIYYLLGTTVYFFKFFWILDPTVKVFYYLWQESFLRQVAECINRMRSEHVHGSGSDWINSEETKKHFFRRREK